MAPEIVNRTKYLG